MSENSFVHMIKLSVGSESTETLRAWQKSVAVRRKDEGLPAYADHITRMTPRRANEVLAGGSIYWVIKGVIQCRNQILDLAQTHTRDGRKACRIVLHPDLVPVVPVPKRAFQGWRYFKPEDAPADLSDIGDAANLPASLRTKLVNLGAW